MNTKNFILSLHQTITWCNQHYPAIRSRVLRPALLSPTRTACVARLINLRASYIDKSSGVNGVRDLKNGRLIIYYPDASLSDGSLEQLSDGYFDVDGLPPWDTWVWFEENANKTEDAYAAHLIAWVSPQYMKLVEKSLVYVVDECVNWLENSEFSHLYL